MNSSFTSEASRPISPGAALVFDRVCLRFRTHQSGRQFRQIALDALRRKAAPSRTDEFWLYRDLSFHIDHGERVGIIGGNGAGKSTLLKVVLGVYRPTSGYVSVRGSVSALIELGAGFNPELSSTENILLSGIFLGFKPIEMKAKTEHILEFAGLKEFRHTPIKYYSSGMLLRLAFAIATDINPEILLIDEIFGAGDAEFAGRAMARMKELLDAAHIAVMVSHNLGLIEEFCTRVIWLRAGAIVADGDPQAVCRAYEASATAMS